MRQCMANILLHRAFRQTQMLCNIGIRPALQPVQDQYIAAALRQPRECLIKMLESLPVMCGHLGGGQGRGHVLDDFFIHFMRNHAQTHPLFAQMIQSEVFCGLIKKGLEKFYVAIPGRRTYAQIRFVHQIFGGVRASHHLMQGANQHLAMTDEQLIKFPV